MKGAFGSAQEEQRAAHTEITWRHTIKAEELFTKEKSAWGWWQNKNSATHLRH